MVKVLPQLGGKIQCLFDKQKRKEYLYQSPWKEYKKGFYGIPFEKAECSGFDDMFPSITECYYPNYPWKGIEVPDHGEVWSLPWDYKINNDVLELHVYGVRFPYKLVKQIYFLRDNCMSISYNAINLSDFDFEFIWAAHPLFNCNENMSILLPDSVSSVINVIRKSDCMGEYGTIHSWPTTFTLQKERYEVNKIRSKKSKSFKKYYILDKMKEGWCALQDTKTKETIALSYPVDKVPYLGIWVNEGGFLNQYNVALEPCTGAFDRVDTAKQWNKVGLLKAKTEYKWFINITIDTKDSINHVDENGIIR